MYIYIYIYTYIHTYICMYIHMHAAYLVLPYLTGRRPAPKTLNYNPSYSLPNYFKKR